MRQSRNRSADPLDELRAVSMPNPLTSKPSLKRLTQTSWKLQTTCLRLPVRRACAACLPYILDRQAARQAGGTQTGNLIFRAKKARNCPPARPPTPFGRVPIRAGRLRD